jgi:ABC-type sugar transport system ATPase subunit
VTDRSTRIALGCEGVSKRYVGVRALSAVSFHVTEGEIVGLLGENGAGKSTLIKVLAGVAAPDDGSMRICGRPFRPRHARDAQQQGVVLVPQELHLAHTTCVLDNIYLGAEVVQRGPFIDLRAEAAGVQKIRDEYRLPVPVGSRLAGSLSLGEQQVVALVRALVRKPRVLLLDEPTSALSAELAELVFSIMRRLAADGVGIVFVTHRMDELRAISDRISVMRDGKVVGDFGSAADVDTLVAAMAGSAEPAAVAESPKTHVAQAEIVYRASHIRLRPGASPVNLDLHYGEVLGISGLNGQGQSELLRVLAGATPSGGSLVLDGVDISGRGVTYMIRHGVVLVPEDRQVEGVFLNRSVKENIELPGLARVSRGGWMVGRRENRVAETAMQQMHIAGLRSETLVDTLSGGTQQKVSIGKFIWLNPRVWLLGDPTRGIDVTTKRDVYRFIRATAQLGAGFVLWSTDLEELIGICDRVIVLYEFALQADLTGENVTKAAVLKAMFGASEDT